MRANLVFVEIRYKHLESMTSEVSLPYTRNDTARMASLLVGYALGGQALRARAPLQIMTVLNHVGILPDSELFICSAVYVAR